jgi:hypothetical protein
MELVRSEMNLLTEVDQPGSAIDQYVDRLDAILKQKLRGVEALKVGTMIGVGRRGRPGWRSVLPGPRDARLRPRHRFSDDSVLKPGIPPFLKAKLDRFKDHLAQEEKITATVRPSAKRF